MSPPHAQGDQHGALYGRMCEVLDLDPVTTASRAVAAIALFGDDSLEAHVARGAEHPEPTELAMAHIWCRQVARLLGAEANRNCRSAAASIALGFQQPTVRGDQTVGNPQAKA